MTLVGVRGFDSYAGRRVATYRRDTMPEQVTDVTLEATIQCGRFKEFIDALNAIVDESKIRISEEGISSAAVDPANVAMVEAKLSSDAFEEYEAEETAIGAAICRLSDLLEYFDDEELLSLTLKEQFKKLELAGDDFSYTYAYISPDSIREEPELPTLDLDAIVEIENDRLSNAVNYFREFATHVTTGYSPEDGEFYMDATEKKGTDDGQFRVDRNNLPYVQPGVARSLFSLDYFHDLTRGLPEEGTVSMEIGEEFPMKMKFGIVPAEGPGNRHHGEVEYLQAPRIQSD